MYETLTLIAGRLDDAALAPPLVARFETQILAECGFQFDPSRCTATGAVENLPYVSPKSGRAVSLAAGQAWRDRLLPLPPFLRDGARLEARPSAENVADGSGRKSSRWLKKVDGRASGLISHRQGRPETAGWGPSRRACPL